MANADDVWAYRPSLRSKALPTTCRAINSLTLQIIDDILRRYRLFDLYLLNGYGTATTVRHLKAETQCYIGCALSSGHDMQRNRHLFLPKLTKATCIGTGTHCVHRGMACRIQRHKPALLTRLKAIHLFLGTNMPRPEL